MARYRFSYILARPNDTSSRSRSFALWVASGIRLVTFNYRAPVVTEFIVITSKKSNFGQFTIFLF